MVRLVFMIPEGKTINADGVEGTSAMKAAVDADVPGIDADCGGACSCATCHVKIPAEYRHLVGSPGDTERDMLEFEDSADDRSRLSCQIILTAEMDGLVLEVTARD
ncbi:MAG: 2Fe-2S iron-sulfur cluster-binding protein [Parvibaculaceae bacterium]